MVRYLPFSYGYVNCKVYVLCVMFLAWMIIFFWSALSSLFSLSDCWALHSCYVPCPSLSIQWLFFYTPLFYSAPHFLVSGCLLSILSVSLFPFIYTWYSKRGYNLVNMRTRKHSFFFFLNFMPSDLLPNCLPADQTLVCRKKSYRVHCPGTTVTKRLEEKCFFFLYSSLLLRSSFSSEWLFTNFLVCHF